MGRKCSVYGCKTGYDSQKNPVRQIMVYGFPKDDNDKRKWINSLPNKLSFDKVTENMGVCGLRWPETAPRARRGKYLIPCVPPSIFPNVPTSCIPSSSSTYRSTKKATAQSILTAVDELQIFKERDAFNKEIFFRKVSRKTSVIRICFPWLGLLKLCSYIKSFARDGPDHKYVIYFDLLSRDEENVKSIKFEAYCNMKSINHPVLPNNRISSWSQLDELITFVRRDGESNDKHSFILQQLRLLNSPKNSRLYNATDLMQGFSWYTRARSLYTELRSYMQLPSVSTLRKITRIAKNTTDEILLNIFFSKTSRQEQILCPDYWWDLCQGAIVISWRCPFWKSWGWFQQISHNAPLYHGEMLFWICKIFDSFNTLSCINCNVSI